MSSGSVYERFPNPSYIHVIQAIHDISGSDKEMFFVHFLYLKNIDTKTPTYYNLSHNSDISTKDGA